MENGVQNKTNLFKKIVDVRKEIDYFHKDSKGYKYTYVSGSQVLSKIKNKMDELGLILLPQMGDIYDEKDGKNYVIRGEMTYTWIDAESGETMDIPWKLYGAQDDISKAFGSGLTYSERYFLLKFFGVPTDDEDPDQKQGDGKQQTQTRPQQKQQQKSQPKVATMKKKDDIANGVKELSELRNAPQDKIYGQLEISILEKTTQEHAERALNQINKWLQQARKQEESA